MIVPTLSNTASAVQGWIDGKSNIELARATLTAVYRVLGLVSVVLVGFIVYFNAFMSTFFGLVVYEGQLPAAVEGSAEFYQLLQWMGYPIILLPSTCLVACFAYSAERTLGRLYPEEVSDDDA